MMMSAQNKMANKKQKVVFRRSRFNPGQWRLLLSRAPYALMAGGVGSGKTTALCVKMIHLRELNWGFPGLLVAPTWALMKGVTLREFYRVYKLTFPDKPQPKLRDPSGDAYLEFSDGGAPIFVRTAKNPGSIEGFSVGFGGMDEARWCVEEAYRNFIARIRLRAPHPQGVLASTPSIGWLSEEFNAGKRGRQLIVAPTRENLRNLRPGYIDDLKVSFSPRVIRAILEGEFVAMEGVVFEEFDGRVEGDWCVDWKPTRRDMERMRITLAIDPGYRRSAWLFIAERKPMEWVVFDQLMLDNTTDMSAVEQVNRKNYPIDEIWVDPAASATQSATGMDTAKVLRHIEARSINKRAVRLLSQRYRDITWGIDKTRILLGGHEDFPIRILFSKQLIENERGKDRGIVKDLSCIQYPEAKDGRPITDLPLKDGKTDHSTDALRYFAVSRWLTTPELRRRDPELAKDKNLGYRLAA